MLPPVTIVMTTWAPAGEVGESRKRSAQRALASWRELLIYGGVLHLLVADDDSTLDGFPHSLETAWPAKILGETFSVTVDRRHGVGASLNRGMRFAFETSPIVLYAVDDWELTERLDITPWVKALLTEEHIGMVRLGPPHPDLTGVVQMVPEGWVLRLDRHHFADGLRPFLLHQRFIDAYGWYDEDESSYEAERLHNLRFCHAPDGGPDIVLALPHPWQHVGEITVGELDPRKVFS